MQERGVAIVFGVVLAALGLVAFATWRSEAARRAPMAERAAPPGGAAAVADLAASTGDASAAAARRARADGPEASAGAAEPTVDAVADAPKSPAAVEVPAGVFEIEVLVLERPASGRVLVLPTDSPDECQPFELDDARPVWLDRGVARFEGLASGHHLFAIDLGPEPLHRIVLAPSPSVGARETIELGDARVHGRVLASDGTPLVGQELRVVGGRTSVRIETDATGHFDAGARFCAGAHVVLRMDATHGMGFEMRDVVLEPRSSHFVTFGPSDELVRFSGRITTRDGQPLQPGDGVPSSIVALRATRGGGEVVDGTWYRFVPIVDSGFEVFVEPDVYELTVGSHFGTSPVPERIDLRADHQLDIVLPGIVAHGRLVAASPSDALPPVLVVFGNPIFGAVARVHPDGRFRFVALEPGAIVLSDGGREIHRGELAADGATAVDLGDIVVPAAPP